MSSAYAELVVNGEYGRRVRLTAEQYVIGRSEDCDILMPEADPSVSRRHAALRRDPQGQWWLLDMGSRNGTKVGPLRVTSDRPYQLRDGDRFSVGTNDLEFRLITTPLPIGAPPSAITPTAPTSPAVFEPPTNPAIPRAAETLPVVPAPVAPPIPTTAVPPISRREPTLMNMESPVPAQQPVTPITPVNPVIPATPAAPITPIQSVTPVTPISAVPPTNPQILAMPPRDEDSVYDGPTVNSDDIAAAYRAGRIAPPPPNTPTPAPIPPTQNYPTPIMSAPPPPPIPAPAAPPPVYDDATINMRVPHPQPGMQPGSSPGASHGGNAYPSYPQSPPQGFGAYAQPSNATPPLRVGPGSSLLTEPRRGGRSSRSASNNRSASGGAANIEAGMIPASIACGVLMLFSLFLAWAQTKNGAGVTFLALTQQVKGPGQFALFLPAIAALLPLIGAMLERTARLSALIYGGGAGLIASTLLLLMKPGAGKGFQFGGTGLFLYLIGCLAALGLGLWVRTAPDRR